MDNFDILDSKEVLEQLVQANDIAKLKEALEDYPPATVVDFLNEKSDTDIIHFLKLLDNEDASRIFSYFPTEKQYELSTIIDRRSFSKIFSQMYSDTRADLFQEMSKEEQIEILPYLDKKPAKM